MERGRSQKTLLDRLMQVIGLMAALLALSAVALDQRLAESSASTITRAVLPSATPATQETGGLVSREGALAVENQLRRDPELATVPQPPSGIVGGGDTGH